VGGSGIYGIYLVHGWARRMDACYGSLYFLFFFFFLLIFLLLFFCLLSSSSSSTYLYFFSYSVFHFLLLVCIGLVRFLLRRHLLVFFIVI